jgi:HTH-type transcriptional regulator/antitoxin HigA
MEEMHLRQVDIANDLGGKNRASEVLGKKRKLTVEMIRNLTFRLNLSPNLLISDYKLVRQQS